MVDVTSIGGVGSTGSVGDDVVTPDVRKQYEQLMQLIHDIMSKPNPTAQDAKDLEDALRQLNGMNDKLSPTMQTALKLVLTFFRGFDPNSATSHLDPTTLQAIQTLKIDINGKSVSLLDAVSVALDPNTTGKGLGDVLLDFANWAYGIYEDKVKDLDQQVQIAINVINNLKALQDILNQIKANIPGNYKLPPDNWNDIPPDIQLLLRNNSGLSFNPDGTPTDMSKVKDWISKNMETYVKWSSDYFSKAIGVIPDLKPDTVANLLKLRKDLEAQRDALIKALKDSGAYTDPPPVGSPLDTINQVLDTLKEFQGYPVFDAKGNVTGYTDTPSVDKNMAYRQQYYLEAMAKKWIMSGQGQGTTNDLVDKALQANQTFSNQASDELKAQNLQLQTLYDILSQLMHTLDKIIQGEAQKINR